MTELTQYAGGCHCGNLRYVFSVKNAPGEWPVRRCTCSYCVRLGARYTSGPDTRLEVVISDKSAVGRYQFGTRTAEFFRCKTCGVMIFVSCQIEDVCYAVLNVNTLDKTGDLELDATDMDFDGEQIADRLARRRQNWIPDVRIQYPSNP